MCINRFERLFDIMDIEKMERFDEVDMLDDNDLRGMDSFQKDQAKADANGLL